MPTINRNLPLRNQAKQIWQGGVAAVHAGDLVDRFISINDQVIMFGNRCVQHSDYQNLIVVGAGKCCGPMAATLEKKLGQQLPIEKKVVGRVNVPDDQVLPSDRIKIIGCRPAGVNLPTSRVLESTDQIVNMVAQAHPNDLVICLLTGGGSALLELPRPPVTLSDIIAVTKYLSLAGASIEQLNLVRRVLSQVKGGGLIRQSRCQHWITLILSDIWSDPLEMIASGPTMIEAHTNWEAPILTQATQALQVLRQFDPNQQQIPASVWQLLDRSHLHHDDQKADGEMSTGVVPPLPGERSQKWIVEHFVLGNNPLAAVAAKELANEGGYDCELQYEWEIDGVDAGVAQTAQRLAQQLWEKLLQYEVQPLTSGVISSKPNPPAPWCLISGGEPTVQLKADAESLGMGGRNQHFILLVIESLIERAKSMGRIPAADFCLLSAGTDGEDGNTSVAGAFFDSTTLCRLTLENPNVENSLAEIRQHLEQGDSHRLLSRWRLIFEPPPTGTNVCDLRVLLVNP